MVNEEKQETLEYEVDLSGGSEISSLVPEISNFSFDFLYDQELNNDSILIKFQNNKDFESKCMELNKTISGLFPPSFKNSSSRKNLSNKYAEIKKITIEMPEELCNAIKKNSLSSLWQFLCDISVIVSHLHFLNVPKIIYEALSNYSDNILNKKDRNEKVDENKKKERNEKIDENKKKEGNEKMDANKKKGDEKIDENKKGGEKVDENKKDKDEDKDEYKKEDNKQEPLFYIMRVLFKRLRFINEADINLPSYRDRKIKIVTKKMDTFLDDLIIKDFKSWYKLKCTNIKEDYIIKNLDACKIGEDWYPTNIFLTEEAIKILDTKYHFNKILQEDFKIDTNKGQNSIYNAFVEYLKLIIKDIFNEFLYLVLKSPNRLQFFSGIIINDINDLSKIIDNNDVTKAIEHIKSKLFDHIKIVSSKNSVFTTSFLINNKDNNFKITYETLGINLDVIMMACFFKNTQVYIQVIFWLGTVLYHEYAGHLKKRKYVMAPRISIIDIKEEGGHFAQRIAMGGSLYLYWFIKQGDYEQEFKNRLRYIINKLVPESKQQSIVNKISLSISQIWIGTVRKWVGTEECVVSYYLPKFLYETFKKSQTPINIQQYFAAINSKEEWGSIAGLIKKIFLIPAEKTSSPFFFAKSDNIKQSNDQELTMNTDEELSKEDSYSYEDFCGFNNIDDSC